MKFLEYVVNYFKPTYNKFLDYNLRFKEVRDFEKVCYYWEIIIFLISFNWMNFEIYRNIIVVGSILSKTHLQ